MLMDPFDGQNTAQMQILYDKDLMVLIPVDPHYSTSCVVNLSGLVFSELKILCIGATQWLNSPMHYNISDVATQV